MTHRETAEKIARDVEVFPNHDINESSLIDAIVKVLEEAERHGCDQLYEAFCEEEALQGLRVIKQDIPKSPKNCLFEFSIRTAAPPGHILDEFGVVRRVLGTLPVTADGCVVGTDAIVYSFTSPSWPPSPTSGIDTRRCPGLIVGESVVRWHECYSTRDAALAAKEGK